MTRITKRAVILAAAFAVSGCSFISDNLFPSFGGDDPAAPPDGQPVVRGATARAPSAGKTLKQPTAPARTAQVASARPPAAQPPRMGTSTFTPPSVTPGSPTGTTVGAKVVQMRGELGQLQGGINRHNKELQQLRVQTVQHAQGYHGSVAAINSRLQVGTTPGNPVLTSQWNAAQTQLDAISRDIALLNSLANRVASDSATTSYLLETTRATYGLSGAVDEDHRQLAILEDEVNRTVVLVDRLLNELSEDINRQSGYVGRERKNLTTLSVAVKNGELMGSSLANRAFGAAVPSQARIRPGDNIAGAAGGRRPLVVIRFDRPKVEYEQALYTAVSRALERRPQAGFDLVAVAPGQGSAAQVARGANVARRSAESVLRSLTSMGLPASRVSLSAGTSGQAQTAEVHIYVR
jgi:TolA-binding protein